MDQKDPHRPTRQQVRLQTIGYLIAAFGLVVGLAWNDAITALIAALFPFGKDAIWVKFVYAAFLTLFVIIISNYLQRMANSDEE